MCQQFGRLLAERLVLACEDQSRDAGGVAGLYAESWKNFLSHFKQPFCDQRSFDGV